jgi:hypothetical protein
MPPHSSGQDVELLELSSSISPRGSSDGLWAVNDEHRESEPLIASSPSASSSTPPRKPRRHRNHGVTLGNSRDSTSGTLYRPSDEDSSCLNFIMEKINTSKARRFLDRIAVDSEPGLTNSQLMLTNHDLKPVEPERRQWGAWNFVGFWIGMLLCNME